MKKWLVAALLLAASWPAPADARHRFRGKEPLSLTVAPCLAKYDEGGDLPVNVTFKNTGKRRTTFVLPDNDQDPPGYVQARVWDAEGRLVTQNRTLEDGWWTSWVLWSGFSFKGEEDYKKGDRVTLKPGGEYTRSVNLARLLAGCDGLRKDGLRAGDYRLQFSYGKVVSNVVEFSIGK